MKFIHLLCNKMWQKSVWQINNATLVVVIYNYESNECIQICCNIQITIIGGIKSRYFFAYMHYSMPQISDTPIFFSQTARFVMLQHPLILYARTHIYTHTLKQHKLRVCLWYKKKKLEDVEVIPLHASNPFVIYKATTGTATFAT